MRFKDRWRRDHEARHDREDAERDESDAEDRAEMVEAQKRINALENFARLYELKKERERGREPWKPQSSR